MRHCSAGGRSLVTFPDAIFIFISFTGDAQLRLVRVARMATRPFDALHG
jgi:hypothetical protein